MRKIKQKLTVYPSAAMRGGEAEAREFTSSDRAALAKIIEEQLNLPFFLSAEEWETLAAEKA